MVKFYLTNKLKYMVSNVNFDYCMVTCQETAHRMRRVFAADTIDYKLTINFKISCKI